jgi:hypothetical protein
LGGLRAELSILLAGALGFGCGRVGFDPGSYNCGPDGCSFVGIDAPGTGSDAPGTPGIDAPGTGIDAPGTTVVPDGLVAYFPLETLVAGQGSYATVGSYLAACEPSCPISAAGRVGSALFFDETQLLRISEDGSFQTSSGFTVAIWIYPMRTSSSTPVSKMYMQPNGILNSYQIEITGTMEVGATTADATGTDARDLTGIMAPLNTWTHIALSWDTTTLRGYVNGTNRLTVARSIAFDGGDLVIGGDENNGSINTAYFFNGRLDEVRIYNRALQDAEITMLANP